MNDLKALSIPKRVLAVFLLLTMLIGMMPALSFESDAADDGYYTVTLRRANGTFNQKATSQYVTGGAGTGANTVYTIPNGVSIADAIPYEELLVTRGNRAFGGWVLTNSSGDIKQWYMGTDTPFDIFMPSIQSYSTGDGSDFYFTATWSTSKKSADLTFNPGSNAQIIDPTGDGTTYVDTLVYKADVDGSYANDTAADNGIGFEYFNLLLQDYYTGEVPQPVRPNMTFQYWTYQYLFDLIDGYPWRDADVTVHERYSLCDSSYNAVDGQFDAVWRCNSGFERTAYTAPTCTTKGSATYTCPVCSLYTDSNDIKYIENYHETYTEPVAALGHLWDDGVQITAPTCTALGTTLYTCERDSSHTKTETDIAALGHDMLDWVNNGDGTSSSDCSRGDYTATKNNTYNIEYFDEGGAAFSGTHGKNAPTTHTFGKATTLVDAADKTTHTFGGWYSDPECTVAVTSIAATEYKVELTETFKLYAKWLPADYTITYYHGSTNITTKTAYFPNGLPTTAHTYGTDTELIDAYKAGWTFEGWYTNSSFTTPAEGALSVLKGDGYTANIKLYAKFTENAYNITYLDKGAAPYSGDTVIADSKLTYTYDDGLTLPTVTKTGYTFGGWFLEEDCSGTKLTKLAAETYTGDQTLYALWTPKTYTITYYYIPAATGSSSNEFNTDTELSWLSEGYATTHTYDAVTALPTVTREGWTWGEKWYTNAACTTPAEGLNELAGDGYTANIKLYTRLVVNTYNIEYYDKGGAAYSGENLASLPTTFTYNADKTLTKGTKTGYTFDGWYTDAECTNKISTTLAKNTYAHDVKLYANWTPNESTITFRNGGGTTNISTNTSYWPNGLPSRVYTYGQEYDLSVLTPVRENYYFLGWYLDKACTATPAAVLGATDYPEADDTVYVYAKWEKVSAHVCTPGAVVIENSVAPTCTADGSYDEVTYCTLTQCGKECSRTTIPVPATGHDYDNGTVTTEPTCTEEGVKTFVCANDASHTYTEPVAASDMIISIMTVRLQPVLRAVGKHIRPAQDVTIPHIRK